MRIARSLTHRGPDDFGMRDAGEVLLAQTRLAVIDPQGGRQPWSDADGNALVFNGELYNTSDLTRRFGISGLETSSDTEILFRLLRDFGISSLQHVAGMFAFAFWDSHRKELLLARDHFGEKPLYFASGDRGVYFASDDSALIEHAGLLRVIDNQILGSFLAHRHVPAHTSIWKGINSIRPGEVVRFHPMGNLASREALPTPRSTDWTVSVGAEVGERLIEALRLAVKQEIVADVPVGVFLSGGIDSSSVALAASLQGSSLDAFTLDAGSNQDDLLTARRVAGLLNMTLHERRLEAAEIPMLMTDAAQGFGSPFADSSAPLVLALSRFAREHVTVALGGDGADELLLGYSWWYPAALSLEEARQRPLGSWQWLLGTRAGRNYVRHLPKSIAYGSCQPLAPSPLQFYRWQTLLFKPAEIDALLGSSASTLVRGELSSVGSFAAVEGAIREDYLPADILTKTDRMSMAASLELRSPFLHPAFASVARALSPDVRLDDSGGKAPLRNWLEVELPGIAWKRPKMGFGAPVTSWLRGPLLPVVQEVAHSVNEPIWSVVNRSAAAPYLLAGDQRSWSLLSLALWGRRFL